MDVTKYVAGSGLLGGIFIAGLATTQVVAMRVDGTDSVAHSKTTLSGPVTWGSPDQPYGKRWPVTVADRAAIASYRSGHKPLVFSTNFTDPAELQANWRLMSVTAECAEDVYALQ